MVNQNQLNEVNNPIVGNENQVQVHVQERAIDEAAQDLEEHKGPVEQPARDLNGIDAGNAANMAPAEAMNAQNEAQPNAGQDGAGDVDDDEPVDSDDEAVDRLLDQACDVKRTVRSELRQRLKQASVVAPHAINGASRAALANPILRGKKVIFK